MIDNELTKLSMLKKDLTNEERLQFDLQYNAKCRNPTTALILSIILGGIAVDKGRALISDLQTNLRL